MEEKKFVGFKKEERGVKEYIKRSLGKGRISHVLIEYTPVGEKIIVETSKPGLVIGRGGEKINELTKYLKRKFKLDNPHIEIREILKPLLDAQLVADDIASQLERRGSLKFKVIAYRMLKEIIKAGAIGTEIKMSGKLPSDRARTWRFTHGYLKKTGEPAKVVNKAQAQSKTQQGVVGIEVSILQPDAHIHDQIIVDEAMRQRINESIEEVPEEVKPKKTRKTSTKKKKFKETEEQVSTDKEDNDKQQLTSKTKNVNDNKDNKSSGKATKKKVKQDNIREKK